MAEILTPKQVIQLSGETHDGKLFRFQALCMSHEKLRVQLAKAQADVRALAAVLKECEWAGRWEGEWECPSCCNGQGRTHAQDCTLALALARPGVVELLQKEKIDNDN